jgi:hypothetical protein
LTPRTQVDIALDLTLVLAYVGTYSLGFTGQAVHEWLGLALALVLLIHLTLHWDWVLRLTRRLWRRDGRRQTVWFLDLLLLVAMTLCVLSGVLISQIALPELGVHFNGGSGWNRVHSLTARLTLGLVAAHIALSWQWIIRVTRQALHRVPRTDPK